MVEKRRWWNSKFDLPDGGPSHCEMWGTKAEAEEIAMRRGFYPPKPFQGEVKDMRASVYAERHGLEDPAVFHTVCYLGFLAARSGVVTAEELVCDGSALHELAHYFAGVRNRKGKRQSRLVMDAILALEARIPGVPPRSVEIPVHRVEMMRMAIAADPAQEKG